MEVPKEVSGSREKSTMEFLLKILKPFVTHLKNTGDIITVPNKSGCIDESRFFLIKDMRTVRMKSFRS